MATNANNASKPKTEDVIKIYLDNIGEITSTYESMKAEVEQKTGELENNEFITDSTNESDKDKAFSQRLKEMRELAAKEEVLKRLKSLVDVKEQVKNLEQLRKEEIKNIQKIKKALDNLPPLKEAEEKDSTSDKEIDQGEEKQPKTKRDTLNKDLKEHAVRLAKVETSMYRLITGQARNSEDITKSLIDFKTSKKQINDTIERVMSLSNQGKQQKNEVETTQVMQAQPTTRLPRLSENPTRLEMIINKIEEKHPKIAGFIRKVTRKPKENQNVIDPVHGEQKQVKEQEMNMNNAVENVLKERNISADIAMLIKSYIGYSSRTEEIERINANNEDKFIGAVAKDGYDKAKKEYGEEEQPQPQQQQQQQAQEKEGKREPEKHEGHSR